MKRFFTTEKLGGTIELSGMEFNHLTRVLRLCEGAGATLCCGDEFDYNYVVERVARHSVTLKHVSHSPNVSNPRVSVSVFMAFIKPDPLHSAITNLNEIGVGELVLFNADRCNVSPKSVNAEKLNTIAQQSCKQCGRSIPLLVRVENGDIAAALGGFDKVVFADETAREAARMGEISGFAPNEKVAIVIGPEGGFTDDERAKLAGMANAKSVSLGVRVLRAETAATVCAAVVLARMGEL